MLKIGMTVFQRGLITPTLFRVSDVMGRHVELTPVSLGATPMQSPASDLRRYKIRSTDEVSWQEQMVRVTKVTNPLENEVYIYEVETEAGDQVEVPEYELDVHEGSLSPDPADMCSQLDFAPWKLVSARSNLLKTFFEATQRSMGIVGYNGARMLPIPHQINAARYALQFGRIRFLLADEVGLGKTIEAGLILATLRKYFPDWSAGIFVPESLTAQWAFEMYGKFGKMIFDLDQEINTGAEEGESISDVGAILPHYKASEYAKKNSPEILIIDEAHRILHDDKAVKALKKMSQKAHAVLLLTATPVSDNSENLLNLFKILDPENYEKFKSAEEMRKLRENEAKIEEILHAIRKEEPEIDVVKKAWKELNVNDSEISDRLKTLVLDDEGRHQLHRLASLIIDRYYPGSRMLRYRRKFLSQDNPLPFRIVDGVEYKTSSEEDGVIEIMWQWLRYMSDRKMSENYHVHRIASALIQAVYSSPLAVQKWISARESDLDPPEGVTADPIYLVRRSMDEVPLEEAEEEILEELSDRNEKWRRAAKALDATGRPLARSGRFQALLEFLKSTFKDDPDSHVLIFTSFEENVHPLNLLLKKKLQRIAEVYSMSARHTRPEREKAAFEFQEYLGGSILLSDELGGEGRNFQFATHVVHFDLPLAPWTVEQRIGRCDRVGRDEEMDVDSQVLVAKGQLDEAFFDFLADGVGVFNESIAPVEAELDRIHFEAMKSCLEAGASGLLDNIDRVADNLEEARERENAELLVRGAVGVEEARRIAEELNDAEQLIALKNSVTTYARIFDSMVDERDEGKLAITVGEFHSLHGLQGIRKEMIGYFDRKHAVRHERLEFFSPGHPFVRSLAKMAMLDSPDRTAIISRPSIKEPALLCNFRVSIPPELMQSIRSLPIDLQPPLLSKSAYLFATEIIQVAVTHEGTVIPKGECEGAYYLPRTEGDKSLHDAERLEEILPDGFSKMVKELSWTAQDAAEDIVGQETEKKRHEFEDLAVEVFTRVHPDHNFTENELEMLMSNLEFMNVDMDSIVYMTPAKQTD